MPRILSVNTEICFVGKLVHAEQSCCRLIFVGHMIFPSRLFIFIPETVSLVIEILCRLRFCLIPLVLSVRGLFTRVLLTVYGFLLSVATTVCKCGVCKYYIGTIGPIGLKYYIGPSAVFLC